MFERLMKRGQVSRDDVTGVINAVGKQRVVTVHMSPVHQPRVSTCRYRATVTVDIESSVYMPLVGYIATSM